MKVNNSGNYLPIVGVLCLLVLVSLGAYYLGTKNINLPASTKSTDNTPVFPIPNQQNTENDIGVKVINGDIVVSKNGGDIKITDWGYNSSPVLSPDGMKIAYISKTKESFENEKKYQGYVPSSTNVWIINVDGSDAIQVTNHDNWVYRDNLLWLDNTKLLFTEGVSSVKVYSIKDKSTQVVSGPTIPEGACVDACGAGSKFLYSPDKTYLVLLAFEGIGGIVVPPKSSILNTKTLIATDINQKFDGINYDSVIFDKNVLSFQATRNDDEEQLKTLVNLDTGKVEYDNMPL